MTSYPNLPRVMSATYHHATHPLTPFYQKVARNEESSPKSKVFRIKSSGYADTRPHPGAGSQVRIHIGLSPREPRVAPLPGLAEVRVGKQGCAGIG